MAAQGSVLIFFLVLMSSCGIISVDKRPAMCLKDTVVAGIHFTSFSKKDRFCSNIRNTDSGFVIDVKTVDTASGIAPWYVLKIWSAKVRSSIPVKLRYQNFSYNGTPKVSRDGLRWESPEDLHQAKELAELSFTLPVGRSPLTLAPGQLVDSRTCYRWVDSMAAYSGYRKTLLGWTKAGKPIVALSTKGDKGRAIIAVFSKATPSDVNGYLAMQEFLRTMSSDAPPIAAFKKKYQLVVFPMPSPDVVDHDLWFSGSDSVDFGNKEHVLASLEMRAVNNFLQTKIKGQRARVCAVLNFTSSGKLLSSSSDVFSACLSDAVGRKAVSCLLDPDMSVPLVRLKGKQMAQLLLEHLQKTDIPVAYK